MKSARKKKRKKKKRSTKAYSLVWQSWSTRQGPGQKRSDLMPPMALNPPLGDLEEAYQGRWKWLTLPSPPHSSTQREFKARKLGNKRAFPLTVMLPTTCSSRENHRTTIMFWISQTQSCLCMHKLGTCHRDGFL